MSKSEPTKAATPREIRAAVAATIQHIPIGAAISVLYYTCLAEAADTIRPADRIIQVVDRETVGMILARATGAKFEAPEHDQGSLLHADMPARLRAHFLQWGLNCCWEVHDHGDDYPVAYALVWFVDELGDVQFLMAMRQGEEIVTSETLIEDAHQFTGQDTHIWP